MTREIRIEPTAEAVALAAASEFTQQAAEAVNARGLFAVALSGGSTPRALYSLLASDKYRNQVPWDKTHFFWGDERDVPPDHPDSNYRMADDAMLSKVPATSSNVHRVRTEVGDAVAAAAQYEEELRKVFHIPEGEFPRFDLILLGMGPDGHTASLVPGDPVLEVADKDVAITGIYQGRQRMTLTFPVINRARRVLWVVTGSEKVGILRRLIEGDTSIPAGRVRPDNALLLADRAAAEQLAAEQKQGG